MWYRSLKREAPIILFKTAIIVSAIIFTITFISFYYEQEEVVISDGQCNIAVFSLNGFILPFMDFASYDLIVTPADVRDFFARAEADPLIHGVLIEVNSPGGTPVASEQVAEIINTSNLPTVSLIGDLGTSGGYLAAAAADRVVASAMSDVGSIGVTMSYLEESIKNYEEGITFVPLASGEFKDAGNPNKPLTPEERLRFEADLQIVHNEFVGSIARLRNMPVAEVELLADGSTMPGVQALEKGLVDSIGGRQVAAEEFSNKLGIDKSAIVFCEYEPPFFFY